VCNIHIQCNHITHTSHTTCGCIKCIISHKCSQHVPDFNGHHPTTTIYERWKPYGSHMEATWKPTGSHMEADWKPTGSRLEADCSPYVSRLYAPYNHNITYTHTRPIHTPHMCMHESRHTYTHVSPTIIGTPQPYVCYAVITSICGTPIRCVHMLHNC
jgi:hypothetical protein